MAFEVDSLVAQDERQWLNGCGRSTRWHAHSELNCQTVVCRSVIGRSF